MFAGRHIPEKGVLALPPALSRAREAVPELRAEILGDGPLRTEVERLVAEAGLNGSVAVPGFVPEERVRDSIRRSLCLALPSTREGYGLVVVEAAAQGSPASSWRAPTTPRSSSSRTASTASSPARPSPDELAAAILRVHEAGACAARLDRRLVRAERATALAGELARDGDAAYGRS